MSMAPLQFDAHPGFAHSVMTLEKPASLPPIVYVTQLVADVRLADCVLRMSPVLAPLQAACTKVHAGCALRTRYGYE